MNPETLPTETCECGEPDCVYVANLTAALDWLEWATAQPAA